MRTSYSRSDIASNVGEGGGASQLDVQARGDRRALEALYLELSELAKQNGLEVEFRLSRNKPEDPAGS